MPTCTKNAEMSKIVSNLKIHLHHCLCESRGFKVGKSNHQRCSVKEGVLENFAKLTEKDLCSIPTLGFLLSVLSNFSEHFFYKTLADDCF